MDRTQTVFGKECARITPKAGAYTESRWERIIFLEFKKRTRELMARVQDLFGFFEVHPRACLAAGALLRTFVAIYFLHKGQNILLIVVQPSQDILGIDALRRKKLAGEILSPCLCRIPAAIYVDGNIILDAECMDNYRTLDKRHPAGQPGLIGETACIGKKNTRRSLFSMPR